MKHYDYNEIIAMDVGTDLSKSYVDIDYLDRLIYTPEVLADKGLEDEVIFEVKGSDIAVKNAEVEFPLLLGSDVDGYDSVTITKVPALVTNSGKVCVPYSAFYSLGFVQRVPYANKMIQEGMPLEVLDQVTYDTVWELVVSRHLASKTEGMNFAIPYPRQSDGRMSVDMSCVIRREDGEKVTMLVDGIPLIEGRIECTWMDPEDDDYFDDDYDDFDDEEDFTPNWDPTSRDTFGESEEPVGYPEGSELVYTKFSSSSDVETPYEFSIFSPQEDMNGYVLSSMDDDTLAIIGQLVSEFEYMVSYALEPGNILSVDFNKYIEGKIKEYQRAKIEEYDKGKDSNKE